ncbi:MAG: hypothetical protein ACR2IA_05125, partial [Pyrinomonadaceae bacterium]
MRFSRLTKAVFSTALAFSIISTPVSTVFAQTAPAMAKLPEGVQMVTSVEGITEYRLPNGLKVLLFPDQTKQT